MSGKEFKSLERRLCKNVWSSTGLACAIFATICIVLLITMMQETLFFFSSKGSANLAMANTRILTGNNAGIDSASASLGPTNRENRSFYIEMRKKSRNDLGLDRQELEICSSYSAVSQRVLGHSDQRQNVLNEVLERLKDCGKTKMPVYFWRNTQKYGIANFGDEANHIILRKLLGNGSSSTTDSKASPKLLMIGSVLQNAKKGDVVWGSGAKACTKKKHVEKVYAVRGPLTADCIGRRKVPFGDPALLFPFLFPGLCTKEDRISRSTWDVCVVPHIHDEAYKQQNQKYAVLDVGPYKFRDELGSIPHKVLSIGGTPFQFVQEICACKLVLSLSLHGIIFSEAYHVPVRWVYNPRLYYSSTTQGTRKFHDYYLGTGRPCLLFAANFSQAIQMPTPKILSKEFLHQKMTELIRSFPSSEICSDLYPARYH